MLKLRGKDSGLFLPLTKNLPLLFQIPPNFENLPKKLFDDPDIGEQMGGDGFGGEGGWPASQGQINKYLIG